MILSLAACNGASNNTSSVSSDTASQTSSSEISSESSASVESVPTETETESEADSSPTSAGTGAGVDLDYDFTHMNDKTYHAHINLAADDEVTEFDESEPNYVRIENEAGNYVADLTLDVEAKDAYAQFQESAEAENEIYEETAFGKYTGYYSDDDGIYGYVLLDTSDETFNVYVMFYVYPFDDVEDFLSVYESAGVQNMLNTIEFKAS